jgi:hypothetical protein
MTLALLFKAAAARWNGEICISENASDMYVKSATQEPVWCKLHANFTNWKRDLYLEEIFKIHKSKHVCHYLLLRENFEDSPYYKGRYLVAANTVRNAERGSSMPYEAAEIIFKDSRYARKVERWLANRRAQFAHWTVRFDGSIGGQIELSETSQLPVKKPVQSAKALPKKIVTATNLKG